jgi:RimJ/RimL family protein N-acetyltransferase
MIKVLKALPEHSNPIWKWRNDPHTQLMSINSEHVSWDDHSKWFDASLKNSNRYIYMLQNNSNFIGMIRFDRELNSAEISINMNPEFRGQKLSKPSLLAGISAFKSEINMTNQMKILAEIKTVNIASNALFLSSGFQLITQTTDLNHYELLLN